jgi:hypothetical protein
MSKDLEFQSQAIKKTKVIDTTDYHKCDLMPVAVLKLSHYNPQEFNQDTVSDILGIPKEVRPHKALNGARQNYFIYRELKKTMSLK